MSGTLPGTEQLFIRFNALVIPAVLPVALAVTELRKRTADAGLTVFLFAIWGAAELQNIIAVAYRIGSSSAATTISIGEYTIWGWDLAFLLWVPAIIMQIHKTNLRLRDERERLRGEMEGARRVQELWVPSRSVQVAGFEIDATYQPATEVGGDFFQLFPAVNDSLLVVVGDVSGKGMKAALLVSVTVGALRNRRSEEPAEVLRELNSVLVDQSEGGSPRAAVLSLCQTAH